jgi:type IV fimbrial biogenesis protein FimT
MIAAMKSQQQHGFTLIELMTGIAVLGILLALAVPGFREFTRNNRVTAAQNDLVTAMSFARSEALKRTVPVSICASTDSATCSNDTNWATGWIVYTDASGVAGAVDGADQVLDVVPGTNGDMNVVSTGTFVQYQPTGTVLPAAATTFTLHGTGCAGPHQSVLTVSLTGSPSVTKQNCP